MVEKKADYAEEIRYMLDLELKSLTNMTRGDLSLLHELLNTPAKLMNLALKRAKGKVRDDILQKKVGEILAHADTEEGFLGLGLLKKIKNRPRLFKR